MENRIQRRPGAGHTGWVNGALRAGAGLDGHGEKVRQLIERMPRYQGRVLRFDFPPTRELDASFEGYLPGQVTTRPELLSTPLDTSNESHGVPLTQQR